MNWEELNSRLDEVSDGIAPDAVDGTGKVLPYIGWYWRSVDFDRVKLGDCGDFIGFMENNKWGYRECRLDADQSRKVSELAVVAADALLDAKAKVSILFAYLQTFKEGMK